MDFGSVHVQLVGAKEISYSFGTTQAPFKPIAGHQHALAVADYTDTMFLGAPTNSRRRFLHRMGAGFGAVALSALWRLEAQAAGKPAVELDPLNPFAARPPHFAPHRIN